MPQIEFPEDQFQRLTALAHAAGYNDLPAFMASFTDEPIEDPRGSLSDDQLRQNVAAMERGDAEIAAGGGQDMKEAMLDIAEKYELGNE